MLTISGSLKHGTKHFSTIYIKFSSIYNDKDDINSKTITQFINSNSVDFSS